MRSQKATIKNKKARSNDTIEVMTHYRIGGSVIVGGVVLFTFLLIHFLNGLGSLGWGVSLILLLIWLASLSQGLLLIKPDYHGYGMVVAMGISSLILVPLTPWMVLGSVIFTLSLLWAYRSIQVEKELLKKVKMVRIARRSIPKIVTGFVVLLAIFYGFTAADILRKDDVEIVPLNIVEIAISPLEGLIQPFFPGYSGAMNMGELQSFLNRILPTKQLIVLVNDTASLEKAPSSFIHQKINELLRSIIEPYRKVAPIFFIIGIFLVFKTLSLPFVWLAIGLVWLLNRALLKMGITEIQKVPTEEENLVLKS